MNTHTHTHTHTRAYTHGKIQLFTNCVTSCFKLLILSTTKGSSAQGRDETKGKTQHWPCPDRLGTRTPPGRRWQSPWQGRCLQRRAPMQLARGSADCGPLTCAHQPRPQATCAKSRSLRTHQYPGPGEGEEGGWAGGRGEPQEAPTSCPSRLHPGRRV